MLPTAALIVVAITMASSGLAVAVPDGFVTGREHEVRVRPVLAELPGQRGNLKKAARAVAQETVRGCDPVTVQALDRVPTTTRAGDDPSSCVVVTRTDRKRSVRLLLGPAYLAGGDLGRARARDNGSVGVLQIPLSERGRARWAFVVETVGATPVAVTLDAEAVGVQPVVTRPDGGVSLTLDRIDDLDDAIERFEQGRSEEVIELGRMASMTRDARSIFADARPRIDERSRFPADCPIDEANSSVVLGCYSAARIYLLRVDRPDLAGVMTVTAAHEMLHAVYAGLDRKERTRVDRLVDDYLTAPDPRVTAALSEYEQIEGADLADEGHSLVGTLVRDLPRALERHYAEYFVRRGAVVEAFEAYDHVFDELQATYDRLVVEVDALSAELASLESQAGGAAAEADRLFREIETLQSQGRLDESNALVGPQNAAANRANSLASRYNAQVATYNAKVAELNVAAIGVNAAYEALAPIDTSG